MQLSSSITNQNVCVSDFCPSIREPIEYWRTYCSFRIPSVSKLLYLYLIICPWIQFVTVFHAYRFDFCLGDEKHSPVENLGQVIFGERIRPSPYVVSILWQFSWLWMFYVHFSRWKSFQINFLEDKKCVPVCEPKVYLPGDPVSKTKLRFLKRGMGLNYQHYWIVGNDLISNGFDSFSSWWLFCGIVSPTSNFL